MNSKMSQLWQLLLISCCMVQVLQAKTKVANGKVFDLAVKLSQGDMPDQIMQVSQNCCAGTSHTSC